MSVHTTSFVVFCHPQSRHAVADEIMALPDVELHHCGDDGKLVVLAQGDNEFHIGETLMVLQSMRGIIAANMVYHGVDEETD